MRYRSFVSIRFFFTEGSIVAGFARRAAMSLEAMDKYEFLVRAGSGTRRRHWFIITSHSTNISRLKILWNLYYPRLLWERSGDSPHVTGFVLAANTSNVWVAPGVLSRVEDGNSALARSDDSAIGKANPFVSVLAEYLVTYRPILRLIPAPVGIDLAGDLRRQLIG
jgi:hypothetical protein